MYDSCETTPPDLDGNGHTSSFGLVMNQESTLRCKLILGNPFTQLGSALVLVLAICLRDKHALAALVMPARLASQDAHILGTLSKHCVFMIVT